VRRLLALLALLVFCQPALAATAPARVASILLCTDEYVFRLLPRSRIAALSYLAGDRHPVVSTIADRIGGIALLPMSAEALLSVKPDAVVLAEGTAQEVRRVLNAARIPIIDVAWPNTLGDIRRITRDLSAKLGVPAAGEKLIQDMDARLAAAKAAAPRTLVRAVLYEPNGYTVAGGITDAMMRAGGLINVAPGLKPTRAGTIAVETILAEAPELLVFTGEPGAARSRAQQILEHPALASLGPRTKRTWLTLTPLLCPGPWSALSAEDFARAAREARSRS
jgi:iron complex transport system substrate-binding protein